MEFWNYQVPSQGSTILLFLLLPILPLVLLFDPPAMSLTVPASEPTQTSSPLHQKIHSLRSTTEGWCAAIAQSSLVRRIRRVVHRIQQIRQPSLIIQRTDTIVIARETRPAGLDQQTRVEEVSSASASASTRSKTVDPSRTHKRSAVFIDPMNFALPSEVTEPDSDIRSVMGLEGRMSNEVERALSGLDWIYSTDDTWVDPRPSRPSTTATI
ncbi:hypothetical protein ONZ45_g9270 [Pleurotus djamor]|nr:hypothetical protein ONZ45_g9270 [Pleurotus djamor]